MKNPNSFFMNAMMYPAKCNTNKSNRLHYRQSHLPRLSMSIAVTQNAFTESYCISRPANISNGAPVRRLCENFVANTSRYRLCDLKIRIEFKYIFVNRFVCQSIFSVCSLEKVYFRLDANELHEIKWVSSVIDFIIS